MEKEGTANGKTKVTQRVLFALRKVFEAALPGILTNLLSDVLGNLFQIETGPGMRMVFMLSIASALIYIGYKAAKGEIKKYAPNSSQVGTIKTQTLMYGSLLSLGIALSLACEGRFSGMLTPDKILQLIIGIGVPIAESELVWRRIKREHDLVSITTMDYLTTVLRAGAHRVTEQMLSSYIQSEFGDPPLPKASLASYVRSLMLRSVTEAQSQGHPWKLNMYDEHNWKIVAHPMRWRDEEHL